MALRVNCYICDKGLTQFPLRALLEEVFLRKLFYLESFLTSSLLRCVVLFLSLSTVPELRVLSHFRPRFQLQKEHNIVNVFCKFYFFNYHFSLFSLHVSLSLSYSLPFLIFLLILPFCFFQPFFLSLSLFLLFIPCLILSLSPSLCLCYSFHLYVCFICQSVFLGGRKYTCLRRVVTSVNSYNFFFRL